MAGNTRGANGRQHARAPSSLTHRTAALLTWPAAATRIVLEKASVAGAAFVAIPQKIMDLPGYEWREGAEGAGYYLLALDGDGGGSFDDFMSDMKELGAV